MMYAGATQYDEAPLAARLFKIHLATVSRLFARQPQRRSKVVYAKER
jgi:hypothetical protein